MNRPFSANDRVSLNQGLDQLERGLLREATDLVHIAAGLLIPERGPVDPVSSVLGCIKLLRFLDEDLPRVRAWVNGDA